MNAARAKIPLAVGTAATVGLLAGAAYFFKIPPFSEEVGDISQSMVCESLGADSSSVEALETILPDASSYSFDDEVASRVSDEDDNYSSACFVSGDDKELMAARTQMLRSESPETWTEHEVRQNAKKSAALTSFEAGTKGVVSSSMAAVLVPCISAGKIPGGQYDLSVVVQMSEMAQSNDAKTRSALIGLAKSAAAYAHAEAKCDLPSKVD
ncbi:hypothetical protein [Streptomyces sp. bgisy032]|uniref:hypothetical protein n=1 Tax=Streptomyces sp. bgisy032 TaxID=3413773 RepID=UPI003D7562B9